MAAQLPSWSRTTRIDKHNAVGKSALSKPSLQPCILRLGFLQDRDVGVGVFLERREILIGEVALGSVAAQCMRPTREVNQVH
jgi:hypothetical protein